MRNYGIPMFFSKMTLHCGGHLELKKCTRGIFWASSEFVWGDVHVLFLKKSAFCNFIPGSTLMLLHYRYGTPKWTFPATFILLAHFYLLMHTFFWLCYNPFVVAYIYLFLSNLSFLCVVFICWCKLYLVSASFQFVYA